MFLGCATLQTKQDVQDGRTALLTGRPDDAVTYFSRAAESNPNYKTSYTLRESVWTYLGRAYYETGKYPEARKALDKAFASDQNDYVARLYLGMTLVRLNDRDRGLAEMETALKGIHEWLENLTSDSSVGGYWDTNKQIRKTIESGLVGNPSAIELVVTAQRVGNNSKRRSIGLSGITFSRCMIEDREISCDARITAEWQESGRNCKE